MAAMQRPGGSGAVVPGAGVPVWGLEPARAPPDACCCTCSLRSPFRTAAVWRCPSVLAARAGPRRSRRFKGIHIILFPTLGSTCWREPVHGKGEKRCDRRIGYFTERLHKAALCGDARARTRDESGHSVLGAELAEKAAEPEVQRRELRRVRQASGCAMSE